MDGYYGHSMWGWGFMGAGMWFFWLIFLVLIVVLVKAIFFKGNRAETHSNLVQDSALEILEKRYAKGEINKEEFEERKQTLLH